MAREAAADGNVDEAQKLYESAIAKAPKNKRAERYTERNVKHRRVANEGCSKPHIEAEIGYNWWAI